MKQNIEIKNREISSNYIKKYIMLYSAFLIYSGTTICAKMASLHKLFSLPFFLFIGLEFVMLGIYAIIWQQALKHFSLVSAMANKGVVVIFGLFWSVWLFSEKISIYNIIGAFVIILGIWVVSIDG